MAILQKSLPTSITEVYIKNSKSILIILYQSVKCKNNIGHGLYIPTVYYFYILRWVQIWERGREFDSHRRPWSCIIRNWSRLSLLGLCCHADLRTSIVEYYPFPTTIIFLCLAFCSALVICLDYDLMLMFMTILMSQAWLVDFIPLPCLLLVYIYKTSFAKLRFRTGHSSIASLQC